MIICCYTELTHQWNAQDLANKLALLPEKLQQQALKKRLWVDKQLSIAGKLLLLQVMKKLNYPARLSDLNYNAYHRPYFDNGPDFNIAHSGNLVICCGTGNGSIGADIELIKKIELAEYTAYFTANERSKIEHHPNSNNAFFEIWTRKEAVLKAIGTGFHTPLSSVDVSEENITYDDITYYLHSLTIHDNYKCHIAITYLPKDILLMRVHL